MPLANGGSVAMPFQSWIVYHWHVAMHQAGVWGGEIDQFKGDIMQFLLEKAA
jgi:hypothetical protein